jgi:hypothetical protein
MGPCKELSGTRTHRDMWGGGWRGVRICRPEAVDRDDFAATSRRPAGFHQACHRRPAPCTIPLRNAINGCADGARTGDGHASSLRAIGRTRTLVPCRPRSGHGVVCVTRAGRRIAGAGARSGPAGGPACGGNRRPGVDNRPGHIGSGAEVQGAAGSRIQAV